MVTRLWQRIDRRVIALVVLMVVLAAVLNVARSPEQMKTVTAHFPRAVSVYKGTDVRILGVTVGKVTAVVPEGESVRVDMEYDADYRLPADAKAVIVTPTLIADRYVQLTPAYTKGEVLADGADIALPHTAVPVELDRIYSSLDELSTALGPNGVNKDGTLDRVLRATQHALGGEGKRGHQMIRELSQAAETFGDQAGPLFDTVTQLAQFTGVLARNDKVVRGFMRDLAGVSRTLAGESDELQSAVAAVARAVGSVKGFVHDNRDALVEQLRNLTTVMSTIVSERKNLDTTLKVAPVAMGNLQAGFDLRSQSQNSRVSIAGYAWDADGFVCAIIMQKPGMPKALKKTACDLLSQLLEPLESKIPYLPPEYDQYLPKTTVDKNGTVHTPRSTPVYVAPAGKQSLDQLIGGGL